MFADKVQRVSDPDEPLRIRQGTRGHFRAGIPQGDQMPSEVAAIDRRNVLRVQRTKIERVVPVVKMTIKALEPAHRFESCFQPLHSLECSDPAEIAGSGYR